MKLFQSIILMCCLYTCSAISFTWLGSPPKSKVQDVSFLVKLNAEKSIPIYGKVVFDILERNIGNGFNISDMTFRPPVSGTYIFTLILQNADKFGFADYCLFKYRNALSCTSLTMPFDQKSITVLVPLNMFDEISVVKIFDSGHNVSLRGGRKWSSFAGELLKPAVRFLK